MPIKEIKLDTDFVGDSSYLSCFDPYIQRALNLRYDFIRRRLFIECLMNDRVFTSLSHILASGISFKLIMENKLLLEEEIIIPYTRENRTISGVIRDKFYRYERDIDLYKKWRIPISIESYMTQIFCEYPEPDTDIKKIAEQKEGFLDSSLSCIVRHTPMPGMITFKNELLCDLKKLRKSVRLKYLKTFAGRLTDFIDDTVSDRMNRNLYFSIIDKQNLDSKKKKQLIDILISNYSIGYLSNLRWMPALDPSLLESICGRTHNKHSINLKKSLILGKASTKALEKFIYASSIPVQFIDSLTADDVVALRKNIHFLHFRHLVKSLISQFIIPSTEEDQLSLLQEATDVANEIFKLIQKQARDQTCSLSNVIKYRNFLYAMFLFAAGTLLHPGLVILLVPPMVDVLTKGGFTHQILCRTHKYDLVFLKHHLERLWMPSIDVSSA